MEAGHDKSTSTRRWWPPALVAVIVLVLAVGLVIAIVSWNRPPPHEFAVHGIDVSHHQGEIDWVRVAASDVRFAFIKSTEGRDHLDTRFRENWEAAAQAGLVRGAYHFFTFCSPGDAQAEHFLAAVPPAVGLLPPVVDVEFAGNCKSWTSIEAIQQELGEFLARIEQAWAKPPILYVTSESRRRIIADRFEDYPVWIRNVFWRPSGSRPYWLFWQYTDEGEVQGIDTPVDLNVYRGELEELAALVRE